MGDSGPAFLAGIAVRTAVVFVLLAFGVRGTGKRQTGELNVHDLFFVLIVANAVQNAMTKGNGSLAVALVSAGTLLLLGWLGATLLSKQPAWEAWLVGAPTVLVEGGRMVRSSMRREGVTEDELMAAVRGRGLTDLAGVRLAVLEIDGSISVVPREEKPGV
jgi:uncharacterized membrane protein YcaP (DUF421 family)